MRRGESSRVFRGTLRNWRSFAPALAAALVFTPGVFATAGRPDPFFASVPFERWQQEGKRKQLRWDVEFFPVELSVHQRLLARVRIEIDHDPATEPAPRPRAVLIEYRDEQGNAWRTHIIPGQGRHDGDPVPRETVVFGNAFLLPGSYVVSIALCDPGTLEHSFIRHRIHAKPLSGDPFPEAWQGLPAVEFLPPSAEPPDEWFLPSITSRLNLPLATRRPLRLDVFVNATPGGATAGSVSAMRRNMSVLIPALKVISQMEPQSGSINVRVLDLVRRRVAFEQDDVHALDWRRLRAFFTDSRPGIIDVSTLAGFRKMRNFFWEQVASPAPPAPDGDPPNGERRVVLILSGPAFFQGQEPLPEKALGAGRGACIFYVRYRATDFPRRFRARPGSRPLPPRALIAPLPEDDLEQAARKLNARVFDVASAADFRRVLAQIVGQITAL